MGAANANALGRIASASNEGSRGASMRGDSGNSSCARGFQAAVRASNEHKSIRGLQLLCRGNASRGRPDKSCRGILDSSSRRYSKWKWSMSASGISRQPYNQQ
jgi:hypothetical protein